MTVTGSKLLLPVLLQTIILNGHSFLWKENITAGYTYIYLATSRQCEDCKDLALSSEQTRSFLLFEQGLLDSVLKKFESL